MKVFPVLVGLTLSISVIITSQALAERRLALVIGNSAYTTAPLENPARDAALMTETLQGAGFEVTHAQNLGYREMQRAVVDFGRDLRAAGEDTVGMVYYAGHAVQANGENYLVPIDADIRDALDLEIQTLETSTLMRSIESAGNRLNLIVLDACRNNPFKSLHRSGTRGLAKIEAPFGTLLAYSTAPGDVATDGTGKNSPYTAALARAIRTPGLAVEQVFKRVRIEVMERTGNAQVPWESSSLTGDFFFLAPQAAAATQSSENAAEIAFWNAIAGETDPAPFEAYLRSYPGGSFAPLAEQRIAALQDRQSRDAERAQLAEAKSVWESVKDSDDPAVLSSLIDRYSDTVYADLAKARRDSLQAAALPPARSGNPFDGKWILDWKLVGQFQAGSGWCNPGEIGRAEFEVSGGHSKFSVTSSSPHSTRPISVDLKFEPQGRAILSAFVPWNNPRIGTAISVDSETGGVARISSAANYCEAELTLRRQ